MNIKILGSGCARCNSLEKSVREVVGELGGGVEVEHVTDFEQIMKYSVMMTPALVIDGKVVSKGSVPGKEEIRKLIAAAGGGSKR